MSASPFFFLERYNFNTNKYELQHPYVWDGQQYEMVDLYPYNGAHDLFSIVSNRGYVNDLPKMMGIHDGIPNDSCEEIKIIYGPDDEDEPDDINSPAHWFTYADMAIYCAKYPNVIDEDSMEAEEVLHGKKETLTKPNPVTELKYRVDAFLEVTDKTDWHNDYSLIRIVYWIN